MPSGVFEAFPALVSMGTQHLEILLCLAHFPSSGIEAVWQHKVGKNQEECSLMCIVRYSNN